MSERVDGVGTGCRHRLVLIALLFWSGLVPVGSTFLANRLFATLLGSTATDGVAIFFASLAIALPFTLLTLLLRDRPAWRGIGATATSLLIAGGYVVLDAVVRVLLPQRNALIPLRVRYAAAGICLFALVPYAMLAAWLAPRLLGVGSGTSMRCRLGLGRFRSSPFLLALGAGALLTVPWPVTGALGDSLASLAHGVQVLARIIPQVFIFWGIILWLLSRSLGRTEGAAVAILIYTLTAFGGFLPNGDLDAPMRALFLLPLGLLLAEMRVRGKSVLPLFPLAFCYLVVPALFVDARDHIAQGVPELQHVASYVAVAVAATLLGVLLWLGRRISRRRHGEAEGARLGRMTVALLAGLAWAVWVTIYFVAGEPGFFNHGFLIILEAQADLGSAYALSDHEARRAYVYEALVETAESTQSAICEELDDLDVSYRRYYVINMVRVDGHRWLMGRFEGRSGVAGVILNPNVRKYPRRIPLPYEDAVERPVGVQENLAAIGADSAWALGAEGAGIIVGGQDTGYDWDHPALKERYRGWDGERVAHEYSWHDAWDGTRVPFDDGSHGTHTMGIVLGDDGGANRIGVAPRAQWIGCRNMRRGFGNPGSYVECMEFLLAPFPFGGDPFADGDVRLAPDVVNNSWGCPRMEGCFPDTLKAGVEALRAAGVVMVVSVGNDGPACGTAATPPANYDASFSVGATAVEGEVVGFSSRGPVDGLTKPDIAAPGERVRSSVPGGGYAYASGTSMAAPHVAGTVALVWSVDSGLVGDVDGTERLLCRTATPREVNRSCAIVSVPEGPLAAVTSPPPCACGDVTGVPNNVYGCGVVDAEAAVRGAVEE